MRLIIALLLLFFIQLASFCTRAAGPAVHFDRLSIEDGLSQTVVLSVLQDQQGFLWFATQDGLNRYDGYEFKIYRHDPAKPHSISNNFINTLHEDSNGTLWVGTRAGGLDKYNADTQDFEHYRHDPADPHSLSHDNVKSILEDSAGTLWVGTLGNGLNRFDAKTGRFTHFNHSRANDASLAHDKVWAIFEDSQGTLWVGTNGGLSRFHPQQQGFSHFRHNTIDPESLSHNQVYAIFEDSSGVLWVGTRNGLNRFNAQTQRFTQFKHDSDNPYSISHNRIKSIYEDNQQNLWIGTYAGGLNKYNAKSNRFTRYKHDPADPHSLSDDNVRSIYGDRQGALWIGTFGGGLSKFDTRRMRFTYYKHQPSDPDSLSHAFVFSIHEDKSGTLWIGTDNGLDKFDPNTQTFSHFRHNPSNPNSLSHNRVRSINEDSNGNLWIGTLGGGLNRFDRKTLRFEHFKHQPSDPHSLSNNTVYITFEDSNGVLWVGTNGGGLNRYNPLTRDFIYFKHRPSDPNSLSNDNIKTIFEDSSGTLWIGTDGGGLNRFDAQTQDFEHFRYQLDNPRSLSHDTVADIYQDSKGILWLGTKGGLNQFDVQSHSFIRYREKDGLANDTILGILEDSKGQLWLSTNKGLSRFNPETRQFRNYDVNDGLQSNEFNSGAYFKNRNGELFFGGIKGFNRFFAENIQDDAQQPTVILTDFLLANQPVPIQPRLKQGEQRQQNDNNAGFELSKTINELDHLTLTHQQNLMSFEFAALHFANPMKNQYAYKLEGQDPAWIFTSAKNRRATYTNIPAGEYTLYVKASNQDGYWNQQGKSLDITILPPPWKTWWAYTIYALLLLTLVVVVVLAERRKLDYERSISLQLKQVDKLKDEFLANTSHELRTPLNGIIGLAESLIDGVAGQLPDTANKNLAMVVASGKRLSNLVNDILDFSKLKNRNLALHTTPIDLHSMTDVVLTLSRPLVNKKSNKKADNPSLELINAVPTDLPAALADEDRAQQIFHNLVGNAIKFTDSGQITVSAEVVGQNIKVSVTDTGIGIDSDQFDSIFDSFEQVEGDSSRAYSGTGLGLAVSKQLVELHGGEITVESAVNQGSTFSFTLPASTEKALAGNVSQAISHLHVLEEAVIPSPRPSRASDDDDDDDDDDSRFRILLVDDEPVNRQVLHNHLSMENYQLSESSGGEEALREIKENGPFDLILLDIMMPKMSGYEVAEKIREDHPPTELPIIMLTAKNQISDLVEGFSCGTNDYLAKPFAKEELLARIRTQLDLVKINAASARFLPSEFLKMLNHKSVVDVRLGDQIQSEMTILFLDIRAFTSLSETMTPKENFDFLNQYLGYVTPPIRDNHGFIDKYMGDAVMALFPEDPDDAVKASISILKQVRIYNEQRRLQNREAITVGIGLHTGSLMLGTIGDAQRMDGTVISDAVNLASRLEGLTKTYGATMVVSEQCFNKLSPHHRFNHRALGRVQVKGKHQSVNVIEIFDGESELGIDLKKASMSAFEKALAMYYRHDFEAASLFFAQVLSINPSDQTAALYQHRCAKHLTNGVDADWDGIERMETK
ncbi:MAG: ligand-binding sensor domain-containing protein/signal transduction histidine kinase/class 3 adenylate cyclase [Phenylobacterium sp.]|jgi:ligand-binding sensor domain-containing protein/signal transduction histidine kinase/class 3 adenylate cyclase/ActR/RegA family two-component response regulator